MAVFFVFVDSSGVVFTLDHYILAKDWGLTPFVVLCDDFWVLVEDYVLGLGFDIKNLLSWLVNFIWDCFGKLVA